MILVDANVLIDIFTNDPEWAEWSEQAMSDAACTDVLAINPIIYSEISVAFSTKELFEKKLKPLNLVRLELPYAAGFDAGKAFLRYRRQGGTKRSPLPDFYIGAHANSGVHTVLTRDPSRYRTYFPEVPLICP